MLMASHHERKRRCLRYARVTKNILHEISEPNWSSADMDQSKEKPQTNSTEVPAEKINFSVFSNSACHRANFSRNGLTVNTNVLDPADMIRPLKKDHKLVRYGRLTKESDEQLQDDQLRDQPQQRVQARQGQSEPERESSHERTEGQKSRPEDRRHPDIQRQGHRRLRREVPEDHEQGKTKLNKHKTDEDVKKLTEILRRHFIFFSLDDSQLKKIIEEMIYCFSPKGVDIIPQGSMASFFFVLDEGEVSILINGEHKRTLVAGQFFGDLALLYNSRRSATVKAGTDCKMWGITRDAFKNQIKKLKTEQYKENRDMLNKVTLFGKTSLPSQAHKRAERYLGS